MVPPKPVARVNKPIRYTKKQIDEMYAPLNDHRREHDQNKGPFYPIVGDRPGMYQSDLMFLDKFNGFIGMVVLVSINRKVAWAVPIRTKTSAEVAKALAKCIDEIHERFHDTVRKIETDEGREFMLENARMLKDRNIQLTMDNPNEGAKTRLGIVERLIRTFKLMIGKHLMQYGLDDDERNIHKDWVSYVPQMLHEYNYEDEHRSIGIVPAESNETTEEKYLASTLIRHQHTDNYWKDVMREKARDHHYTRIKLPTENDAFAKEGRRGRWTAQEYNLPTRYGGGPSLLMHKRNHPDSGPIVRRPMPYMLKWYKD